MEREGTVIRNDEPFEVGKGSCFLFRPGDHTSATHNPQKPLVLTYSHFRINELMTDIPQPYRRLTDTVDFEYMLSRYVRLFLVNTFAAQEEGQLILKQLMIHLLRHDREQPEEKKASNQLTEAIHEIANYVQQHPGKPHRVEDLAARAGLSPRYFSIKFKELIGTPSSPTSSGRESSARSIFASCGHERNGGGGRPRLSRHLFLQQAV